MATQIRKRGLETEITISATKSSGAGGQNVNKVNTKVELRFSIPNSSILSNREKELLVSRLGSKLTRSGDLILSSEEERSQLRNKNTVIEKFYGLIEWGVRPVKKRIPTKPTKASKRRRIDNKRKNSEKKSRRRNDF
ncbi:alternative ribosome rescue aminoacyl-tRNA hydrolase ArfB [Marinilabilia rubra]|uniref:Aminoacyl-tRNA hydrolase n=1 Tax=Marinilabilia rubra TaxID=2162893 RepID=A0A2U2B6N3_9BACT|nr:alternative ribosome rescue aminoacyl-tRNA hydrolase ArfB [Marinilabilia rubra]PWD98715.1 aminoacyl-tRNA hydrolase [Marinilabilia rubra]